MNDSIFRWLHLSDFHIGKDEYGQQCLFNYILENIKESVNTGKAPSAIFITGDIGNSGLVSEYGYFFDKFFYPLLDILNDTPCIDRIFIVPGNHDVTRNQARAVQTHGLLERIPTFLDPTIDAQSERISILPRFKAFMDNDLTCSSVPHWISSPEGAFFRKIQLGTKQIGFLGLNSAWFSGSDSDRHNLSPGKAILEQGLVNLSESDLIFILSHHPIDWFLDSEVPSLQAMLMKKPVIYLHGHLHKTKGDCKSLSSGAFLQIQAGAAFQARENEQWVNRIIWGEADIEERTINMKPLFWSRDHQEWSIDTTAFPNELRSSNQDHWSFSFPREYKKTPEESTSPKDLQKMVPSGWLVIDKKFLSSFQASLSDEEAIKFFDGRVPSWKEALSPKIPRRSIVSDLVDQIKEQLAHPNNSIFLLKGPGGEGKSTILRQTIVELLNKNIIEQIFWNENSELDVPNLNTMSVTSGLWIIASDDAENIAGKLFKIIKDVSLKGAPGICLLLSCRDTDWIAAKCDQIPWQNYAHLVEQHLRGLSENDAEAIVTAWSKYNQQGLGRLYGLTHEEAVKMLLSEAHKEAYGEEGAFLGAMLRTRMGDDIRAHVRNLLHSLGESYAPGGTLRDAFAHIAIPHAENILILSRGPLAQVLGCNRETLKAEVLGPLGEEAVIASYGQYILTRHRAIAETAVDILSKEFHVETDEIILKLMIAALELSSLGLFVPNLGTWRFLSTHLFNAGKHELGVRLAQAAYEYDRSNPFFIVQFARLLRQVSQPDKSVEICRESSTKIKRDRTFYFEWGISEGVAGNRCNSICLAAMALADNTTQAWPTSEDASKAFAGMGTTFGRLYDLYNDIVFIEACSATAQLGAIVKHDEKGEGYFKEADELGRNAGIENVSLPRAFTRFTNGVLAAWERREMNLSDYNIPAVPELQYERLCHLLQISSSDKGK
jgi:hypothetical protein